MNKIFKDYEVLLMEHFRILYIQHFRHIHDENTYNVFCEDHKYYGGLANWNIYNNDVRPHLNRRYYMVWWGDYSNNLY